MVLQCPRVGGLVASNVDAWICAAGVRSEVVHPRDSGDCGHERVDGSTARDSGRSGRNYRRAHSGTSGLLRSRRPDLRIHREPDAGAGTADGWTAAIGSPRKRVLCAAVEGRIVGIAAMGPPLSPEVDAGTVGQLYQIHVVPSCWRKGIGSTLHALFVRYLREVSLPTGLLEVWERNGRARAFYTSHGWRPDGEFREGPDNSRYVNMRLELAAHRAAAATPPREGARARSANTNRLT
ncbi:GNAT family N-acetyltransferase [Micromonospora chersina]|uniref:GNAT family N-acetyltransferase n=1 Tax=Micromonospora chersina TaxID=47854 RepID=UPI00369321F2